MRSPRGLCGLILAAATLAACATLPPPAEVPGRPAPARPSAAPPTTAPVPIPSLSFNDLPGWGAEDHLEALAAIRAACRVTRSDAMLRACRALADSPPSDEAAARTFLERHFRPELLVGDGLLTGYFAPVYEARAAPEPPFTAPVRPPQGRLDMLLASVLNAPEPEPPPSLAEAAEAASDTPPPRAPVETAPDRAGIEAMPADDALAWMRPEDLFFMQIQGSGVLVLPDGRRLKAVFGGSNGRPFVGLARVMRQDGLIDDAHSSGEAIRSWLADHRGAEADVLMRRNPRYVFFRLVSDDGLEPAGAAGVPLPPGRSLAMDLSRHTLGELYWIDAQAPALAGAFPTYRRVAAALDTGGAIRGDIRADLYFGKGEDAGRLAGRVRHRLQLYRLDPVDPATAPSVASNR